MHSSGIRLYGLGIKGIVIVHGLMSIHILINKLEGDFS